MTTELKNNIISYKMQSLQREVDYYMNTFIPDSKEHTGWTQSQLLQQAKEKVERFKIDLIHYREHKRFDLLDIKDYEQLNFIRLYAVEQRDLASDFKDNPYIKVKALRNCVKAIKEMIKIEPRLEVFSNHWLASRNEIKIK